jgi:hypothetical protein
MGEPSVHQRLSRGALIVYSFSIDYPRLTVEHLHQLIGGVDTRFVREFVSRVADAEVKISSV